MRWSRRLPSKATTLERVTIRGALLVGFGVVFALWMISGQQFVQRLDEVRHRITAVNGRYTRADVLLSSVRTNVLLGSVYLRDALLDQRPGAQQFYHAELESRRRQVEEAIGQYVPLLDSPEERARVAQLRAEIDDYWNSVLPVFGWDAARRSAEARALLTQRIIPKRELIIRISDGIQTLNRAAFEQQQIEAIRIYTAVERRVSLTGVAALVVALFVAVVVFRLTSRLEARIREHAARNEETMRDLQRLSARLVNAQEEERRTIARELHDEIGQALTAIKLELGFLARAVQAQGAEARALESARGITDRAIQNVRDLSKLLHPPALDDLGLPATLDWLLNGFSARTGLHAELLQDGMEERLPADVEVAAYRIVQEALTNVARHAEASKCRVYLQRRPTLVLVTIEDNGKGFDVGSATAGGKRRGLGLLGIQERAAGCRGTLRLDSTPGYGTRLTVELPVAAVEAGREQEAAVPTPGSVNEPV